MANPSTTLYPSDTFYPSDGAGKGAGPFTALSIMALPGRRHSFIAKTAATAEKGAGPFTELSALGLPGQRHAFTPKTAAQALKGLGPFTALSVLALPGQRQEFSAKAAAAIIAEAEQVTYGRRQWQRTAWINDDEDLLDIIAQLAATGILDN
jgi:hypothetical protein